MNKTFSRYRFLKEFRMHLGLLILLVSLLVYSLTRIHAGDSGHLVTSGNLLRLAKIHQLNRIDLESSDCAALCLDVNP